MSLYRLNTYEHGFMIERGVKAKKDGKTRNAGDIHWQAFKYPKDLEHALEMLLEIIFRERASVSIDSGVDAIRSLKNELIIAKSEVKQIAQKYMEAS